MKLNKLCAFALATMAFAACSNDDNVTLVNPDQAPKSVTVTLPNVQTAGRSIGAPVANGTTVTLTNFQIFFSDGTNLYEGKSADGAATTHFFTAVPGTAPTFHHLPGGVKEVIVIGNLDQAITVAEDGSTLKSSLEKELLIADEQQEDLTANHLTLYGISGELAKATEPDPNHGNYYTATVNLVPRIARIEVGGFEYKASGDPAAREYTSLNLEKFAINNYYGKAQRVAGTASDIVNTAITAQNVFGYFDGLTTSAWNFDSFTDKTLAETEYKADGGLAYHVFPTQVPQLLLRLTGVKGTGDTATETPLYLATSNLLNADSNNAAITAVEAGKIYKVNFVFDDNDLTHPNKCINVTVDVAEWEVVNVVPEF